MAKKAIIGFAENGVGQVKYEDVVLANTAPLASGANAAAIAAKVNELIAGLKAMSLMVRDWTVKNTLTDITSSNSATVAPNATAYSATLTAGTGFTLPDAVTVKVNGTALTSGYTWTKADGSLSVTSVTGDLEIIAVADEEA